MKNWKEMPIFEIVFRILGILLGCTAIVFGILTILQIFDVFNANFHFLPWGLIFLGGENLCNTVYTWKNSRGAAKENIIISNINQNGILHL
jgi:hypothetical protein